MTAFAALSPCHVLVMSQRPFNQDRPRKSARATEMSADGVKSRGSVLEYATRLWSASCAISVARSVNKKPPDKAAFKVVVENRGIDKLLASLASWYVGLRPPYS